MAPLLRLLITLVVLVGLPGSALGCAVPERVFHRAGAATSQRGTPGTVTAAHGETDIPPARLSAADVGKSSTSTVSGVLRSAARGRGGLLFLLSHALGDADEQQDDEFEADGAPDLAGDDGSQGFAVVAFSGLSMPQLTAIYVESNVRGIKSSIGHPHGVDEPPRI